MRTRSEPVWGGLETNGEEMGGGLHIASVTIGNHFVGAGNPYNEPSEHEFCCVKQPLPDDCSHT